MTSATAASSPEVLEAAKPAAPRSLLHRTLDRPGAWVGYAWLGLIALAGIFAPFIASSHPWKLVLADGTMEYPLLA
ncbi:MAG: ABC transporter permease, partial [Planctomycetota bacterium]